MMNEFLIRKAKKGDKDAFCRLMDEQVQCMYKVAFSYLKNDEDAADAIQDTILSCYENLKSLKQNKYFKTWMIRILINKCKDILQRKKQSGEFSERWKKIRKNIQKTPPCKKGQNSIFCPGKNLETGWEFCRNFEVKIDKNGIVCYDNQSNKIEILLRESREVAVI